jgi:hypothetical protein
MRPKLTFANVISCLALFIALGGLAVAAGLPKNSVGTKQLKKNAVTAVKVKDGAIGATKLQDGAIGATKIQEGAIGATKIQNGAIGTAKIQDRAIAGAQIQDHAITGAQIADGSLTGTQVNASTLGTVPSAVRADRADSLPPAEAWHLVGAPGEPPFLNGWQDFEPASLLEPVAFFKDHEGIVHLKGRATRASPAGGLIFALPPGFRPATNKVLIQAVSCECSSSLVGELDISGTKPAEESNSGAISGPSATTVGFDGVTFRAES